MSFLLSLVVMGVQVLISTEILSLFNAINFYAVLLWWIVSFSCLLGIILKNNKNNKLQNIRFKYHLTCWNTKDKLFLILLVVSLLFLLLNAILTAPNNWDGLVYHLPKVMHWIQNQNLDYYATHIESQVSLQGFAEYIILHTFLLTGDDCFANSVQWLSMLGSLVAVSKIAQYLGASIKGQLLVAFLLLTTPIALHQATSIQNDLVATVWVLITYLFFFKFKENFFWKWSIIIGVSMAMALLTKSTSYMYLLPIVIYVIFLLIKNKSPKVLYAGFIISLLVITLNIGYYVRNVLLCGSIVYLHKDGVVTPVGKLLDAKVALSNITKNVIFNFSTPFYETNHFFDNVARGTHKLLEIDINDITTSFGAFEMIGDARLYSQDYAANPLQMLFFFIMLPLIYIFREKFSKDFFLLFFMGIAGSTLVIFLLKWQPFSTRFQVPFWAIIATTFAVMADKLLHRKALPILILLLWTIGSHYLYYDVNLRFKEDKNIFNTQREEISASFRGERGLLYVKLVNELAERIGKNKCLKFSLITGNDDWEYYLWTLLHKKGLKPIIKATQVKNITATLEDKTFKPCILIQIESDKNSFTFKEINQK